MKSLVHLKAATSWMLIAVTLAYFAFSPQAQAVVPAPDGGYPGFNTAEGQNALFSLSTGVANTAVGWYSLWSNTDGSYNTAVGVGTLLFNVGDQGANQGIENTAIGAGALLNNTTGVVNTANGALALFSNSTGFNNTASGASALFSNTTGFFNTASGANALLSNTTGSGNTGLGSGALLANTTGSSNTATGSAALFVNTTGHDNTAVGGGALQDNTGDFNTATGSAALLSNTAGASNNAFGDHALTQNTTGSLNVAVGSSALFGNTTGSGNIALGFFGGSNVITANNAICIGTAGNDVSDSCYIGNIFGATSTNGLAVYVNSNGRLGTATSSKRFKEDIKPMADASETLFSLKPVTFRYRKGVDPEGPGGKSEFGLVAEDVESVNADLIVRDKEGRPYSVRYDQVNAMLLNEFLKEHRKVKEMERGMSILAAQLKEQAAQIQKVSARIEIGVSASPSVANNH